ncbi:MAG: hypothetical protein OIF54_18895 [Cohaesibacter sp.]|nr:hypothetical protein [Cohaesibacter sp.]
MCANTGFSVFVFCASCGLQARREQFWYSFSVHWNSTPGVDDDECKYDDGDVDMTMGMLAVMMMMMMVVTTVMNLMMRVMRK